MIFKPEIAKLIQQGHRSGSEGGAMTDSATRTAPGLRDGRQRMTMGDRYADTLEVLVGVLEAMQEQVTDALGAEFQTKEAALLSIDRKLTVALYMAGMLGDPR